MLLFYDKSNLEFFAIFISFWYLIIFCFKLLIYVNLKVYEYNYLEYFLYYVSGLVFVFLIFYRIDQFLIFYTLLFSCGLGGLIILVLNKIKKISIFPYGLIIILALNLFVVYLFSLFDIFNLEESYLIGSYNYHIAISEIILFTIMLYSFISKKFYLIYKPLILMIIFIFTTYIIDHVGTKVSAFIDLSPLVFIMLFFITLIMYLICFIHSEILSNTDSNFNTYVIRFSGNLTFAIYILNAFLFVKEHNFLTNFLNFYILENEILISILLLIMIISIMITLFLIMKNFIFINKNLLNK